MKTVKVRNDASYSIRRWVTATLPGQRPFGSILECTRVGDEDGLYAVVGEAQGSHSHEVHIPAIQGPQTVRTYLLTDPEEDISLQYVNSDWVVDDPGDILPIPLVVVGEQDPNDPSRVITRELQLGDMKVEMESENAALVVWQVTGRLYDEEAASPLWMRAYLYVYSGQDIVPFDLQVIHSDTSSAELGYDIQGIRLISGEFHKIDHHALLPFGQTQRENSVWTTNLLGPTTLATGQRFTVTGRVYAHPQGVPWASLLDPQSPFAERVDTIKADFEKPPEAVLARENWDGRYLALGAAPQVDTPGFRDRKLSSYWDYRDGNLAPHAGQTGDQDAFGLAHGLAVLSRSYGLERYRFSVSSFLRPTAYYKPDRELATLEEFPNWKTWSQLTHSTSGEQFNKPPGVHPPSHGWSGVDNQHFSFLPEQACYALTGRRYLRDLILERTEPFIASYADGALRAVGRTFLTAANDYLLTGDDRLSWKVRRDFKEKMAHRVGRHTPLNALEITNDPRALVDANGNAVEAINIWQHGLGFPGLLAAYKVFGEEDYLKLAVDCARVILTAGFFRTSSGRWQVCDYVRWDQGAIPPKTYYSNDGNRVGYTHTTGWFWDWCIAAVQWVALPSTPGNSTLFTGDEFQKAVSIMAQDNPPSTEKAMGWRAL